MLQAPDLRFGPCDRTGVRSSQGYGPNHDGLPLYAPRGAAVACERAGSPGGRGTHRAGYFKQLHYPIASYKRQVTRLGPRDPGGESLEGTPWEQAWHEA